MIFNNLLSSKKNWPKFFIEKSAVHQLTSRMAIHQEKNEVTAPSSHLPAHGYIRKKSLRYPHISYRVRHDVPWVPYYCVLNKEVCKIFLNDLTITAGRISETISCT